jgi:hypothetical protein
MILFEHRRIVQRQGPARFVSAEELSQCTGFRSVYGYAEGLAAHLATLPSHAGVTSEASVYSDTLFVDFDSDDGIDAAVKMLGQLGLAFEVWSTGRRGVHVHIACVPMQGSMVPASQRAWVEQHLEGDWDATIYRPGALIRLPGTWHEKAPGKRKELMYRMEGSPLAVPMLAATVPTAVSGTGEVSAPLPAGEFWAAVMEPKENPGRNARLFHLGALAARGSVPYDEALEAVRDWAHVMADPPLTNDREVERTFRNGYRKGAIV